MKQTEHYIDIFTQTLKRIEMPQAERKKYMDMVMNIYARRILSLSVDLNDKKLAKEQLQILKSIGTVRFRDKFACAAASSKLIKLLFLLAKKIF